MKDNNEFIDILNDELLDHITYKKKDVDIENGYVYWKDIKIVLDRFRTPLVHDSDCGIYNEPEQLNTECNCKMLVLNKLNKQLEK